MWNVSDDEFVGIFSVCYAQSTENEIDLAFVSSPIRSSFSIDPGDKSERTVWENGYTFSLAIYRTRAASFAELFYYFGNKRQEQQAARERAQEIKVDFPVSWPIFSSLDGFDRSGYVGLLWYAEMSSRASREQSSSAIMIDTIES